MAFGIAATAAAQTAAPAPPAPPDLAFIDTSIENGSPVWYERMEDGAYRFPCSTTTSAIHPIAPRATST